MRSRALSLATVAILTGLFGLGATRAENLEAGKPPAKIFADTCSACHKSSRGLLKTVPAISLPGFLRQHYTTSGDMASLLSAFLLSSGAADHVAETPKPGKKDAKPEAPNESPGAATAQGETAGQGKKGRQAARTDTEAKPGEIAGDGRDKSAKLGAKSKRGKKGAPAEVTQEPGKDQTKPAEEAAKSEPSKSETAKSEPAKSEMSKSETSKSETAKPDETKPDTTKPSAASAEPNGAAADAAEKSGAEKSAEPASPGVAASASPAGGANTQENKPADTKAREASLPLPPPAAPTSNPRPAQRPMLTLPGFPPPVADTPADTTPAATSTAQSPTSTPPAPAADKPDEQKSATAPEPLKADATGPAKPNAAKSVADQAADSAAAADSPKLDIIQEESHGPGQASPPKTVAPRKKRASQP